MAYTDQDFEMYIGDHKNVIFTVDDEDSIEGFTVTWKVANFKRDDVVISKSSTDADEITILENTFIVHLLPADTEDLEPYKRYFHEAQIIDGSSNITTVSTGAMVLYPQLIE
jgi:hypothetical protein